MVYDLQMRWMMRNWKTIPDDNQTKEIKSIEKSLISIYISKTLEKSLIFVDSRLLRHDSIWRSFIFSYERNFSKQNLCSLLLSLHSFFFTYMHIFFRIWKIDFSFRFSFLFACLCLTLILYYSKNSHNRTENSEMRLCYVSTYLTLSSIPSVYNCTYIYFVVADFLASA